MTAKENEGVVREAMKCVCRSTSTVNHGRRCPVTYHNLALVATNRVELRERQRIAEKLMHLRANFSDAALAALIAEYN